MRILLLPRGQPADKQHRLQLGRTRKRLPGIPRYFHNQTLATSETCLSAGLWGSSDYLYLKPFSTTGFVASILRKSGLYDGGYLYYMPVLFSTDETLLCRAEAYALKKMYPSRLPTSRAGNVPTPATNLLDTRPDQCVL